MMFMVVIVIFKAVDASFVNEVESWVAALMKVMVANHKCEPPRLICRLD